MGRFDHPLKDFFRARRYSQSKLARDAGISPPKMCKILLRKEKPSLKVEAAMYRKARELGYAGPIAEGLKECELCRDIVEDDGNGRLCNQCKGLQETAEGFPRKSIEPKHTCAICGDAFDPYKHGRSVIKRVCKKCLTAKITKTSLKAAARKFPEILLIDFEDEGMADLAEEIRRKVERAAKENFRTINAQLIWILKHALE